MLKILALLLFVLVVSNVFATTKEVIVTGKSVVTDTTTLQQARNQALNQARSLAVEQAVGVTVNSALLLQNALIVSELVKTFSHGFLIDEEILAWQGEWVRTNATDDLGLPVVSVKIKGLVDIPAQSYFRNFVIDAKINKQTFRNGESAVLEVSAKDDVYIVIANYTSSNKIIPIFPIDAAVSNHLRKNEILELPGKYENMFDITVNTYPGHKQDIETFIFLGIPHIEQTQNLPWAKIFQPGVPVSYTKFFETILELQLPWIAEKTLIYTVVEH